MSLLIYAHRGASAHAPENTLEAFALAKEHGADGVELDVQVTRDRKLVVFHDDAFEVPGGRKARIREVTFAELRAFEGGAAIPSLDEVLVSEDRPAELVIELKSRKWSHVSAGPLVAKALRRTGALERGPVVVSSFNPMALLTFRRVAPHVPRAMLAWTGMPFPLRRLWLRSLIAPDELHLEAKMVDAACMRWANASGRRLIA
ncbi:MAG: glycerophosphodiester phosphodiesterase, partial [Planctomycetota bacterium]